LASCTSWSRIWLSWLAMLLRSESPKMPLIACRPSVRALSSTLFTELSVLASVLSRVFALSILVEYCEFAAMT
jgi:hypothetical protein